MPVAALTSTLFPERQRIFSNKLYRMQEAALVRHHRLHCEMLLRRDQEDNEGRVGCLAAESQSDA